MNNSSLIKILKSLSSKEMKSFGEYVKSPFFNKNKATVKLYDYLMRYHPEFREEDTGKEKVFKKTFPGVVYNDGFMRSVMFSLSVIAEDYLAYINYRTEEFASSRHLISELNLRNIDKHMGKKLREILNELNSQTFKDALYYYNKSYFENERNYLVQKIYYHNNDKLMKEFDVENFSNDLTCSYLARMMRFYIFVLTIKRIYNKNFETKVFENIINNLDPEYIKSEPLIRMYYNIIMMILKNEEHYYYELKNNMGHYEKNLRKQDFEQVFVNMENFCTVNIKENNDKFYKEFYYICRLEIEKNAYKIGEYMPDKLYKKVAEMSFVIGENQFARNFIEKYRVELNPSVRDDTYTYCLAYAGYSAKNYEDSLKLLAKVKLYDIYIKLDVKILISIIYYELNINDLLMASVDSFRHFLANDTQLPEGRKEPYTNFIKFLRRLQNLRYKNNNSLIDKFNGQVDSTVKLAKKEWFKEKISGLK